MTEQMSMLKVSDLEARYGQVTALSQISIDVAPGQVVAIIGPNGAGKTTLLRAISGLHKQRTGRITLDGVDIGRLPPHRIVRAGCVQLPEGRGTLAPLTVTENLRLAGHRVDGNELGRRIAEALEIFPALTKLQDRRAGLLSGGEQQMLAMARALVLKPRVLLLDEPSIGLAPGIVIELVRTLRRVAGAGTALVIAEQNMALASQLADHLHLMVRGQMRASGAPSELPADLLAEITT